MRSLPSLQRRSRPRLGRLLAAGAVVLSLAAAGCSSNSSASSGSTPVKGGTAVWAEPPSSPPTYIFPYTDSADESNLNNFEFQYLMYRPLYWFGQNGQPVVDYALSVANAPRVNGRTLTITLKHYMWSDGTPVTAQDVVFWLNMELAVPADYGSYTGFPANTTNVKVVSPTELQLTMNKPYSLTWFLYNELSQVTPMPAAWDRTASGPSHCDTTVSDCAAVYKYLAGQAKDLSTYATSPIWSVVDGPWKLSSFNADPYPYNPAKAKSLLTSHGWKVVRNGTSTCVKPGTAADECGAGITAGTALTFSYVYESGVSWVQSEVAELQSDAASIGMKLTLQPKPFADVIAQAVGNCVATKVPCNWDMANWGFGWSFSPNYLPTGETLFQCGAVANSGGYCDKTNDSLIGQTLTSSNLSLFYKWQDYLAPQLPVMYQPNAAFTLTEVANNLKGVLPQSPTLSITPESWYFVK